MKRTTARTRKQMKLVVTGALGHIGSRLLQSVQPDQLQEVVIVDNFHTQRYCSLYNLPPEINYRLVEADVTDPDFNLLPLLDENTIVVHLAAITNAPASFQIQEEVERVNFRGTQSVAEACLRASARLIFVSTTSVYGVSDGVVTEECSDEELKPQSPYAESKLAAERSLQKMGSERGLRFVTFRFGTIYGTSIDMRFHTAVNKFIWQACFGEPLTVWRTALDQQRPYLDLTDAIRAIQHALTQNLFDNRIYNVVTDNLTVRQITETIRREIPDLEIRLVDSAIMNQLSYIVDRSRIESKGFTFRGSLSDATRDTVTLFRPFAMRRGAQ